MRIFPHRGMPARGSFQERILQEMLLREQRKQIAIETYHGHLLAAGLAIKPELFGLWTENLIDEITHSNYAAATIARKKKALSYFTERNEAPRRGLMRAHNYTVKNAADMMPYTKDEIAAIRDKVRARLVDTHLRHAVERPVEPVPSKKQ